MKRSTLIALAGLIETGFCQLNFYKKNNTI